uniref:Uncharacterized protein n=1 Tax=Glossina pallidipes TaxID=7398 RepID=A0A1B0A3V3_GLOPL
MSIVDFRGTFMLMEFTRTELTKLVLRGDVNLDQNLRLSISRIVGSTPLDGGNMLSELRNFVNEALGFLIDISRCKKLTRPSLLNGTQSVMDDIFVTRHILGQSTS